jgi:predicted RNA binding protein YcfA (HicA-like mRNA interferase family)
MHKLLSSGRIIKILESNGFYFVSQKGSHPRKEIPVGTLKSIIRQSGIEESEFK